MTSQQDKPTSMYTSIWCLLPYLGMVGRFCGDDPHFGNFQSDFITQHNPIDPSLSAEKNGLSLLRLVPEILESKVGLIFHQNLLFNRF